PVTAPKRLGYFAPEVAGGSGVLKDLHVEYRPQQQRHRLVQIERRRQQLSLDSAPQDALEQGPGRLHHPMAPRVAKFPMYRRVRHQRGHDPVARTIELIGRTAAERSEERRVGEECRSRWW